MTTRPLVLCVDDDIDLLHTIGRILRRGGHEVVTVSSPIEALAILTSRTVAVLVSDFEMPEMNGVELAVRARAVQPETVRILLTGRNTVDTVTEGINVGEVYRFLSKPFDPATLLRAVAAATTHHGENAAIAAERTTVVRRRRMLEALEADHPGITLIPRDDAGAYLLDPDARARPVGPGLAAIVALVQA